MCTIFIAYKSHPKFPFVFIGNRDEFYNRPTANAHQWQDYPSIFGGKDLKAGGTWLGVNTHNKRFSTLTNYRDLTTLREDALSRGDLVVNALLTEKSPSAYLSSIKPTANQYNDFNLIVKSNEEVAYFSNRENIVRTLSPGIYGLSNHLLDTPWPKVKDNKLRFDMLIRNHLTADTFPIEEAFQLLHNKEKYPDDRLPQTGIPHAFEQVLSALFIESPQYGTRVSTVYFEDNKGSVYFEERAFNEKGEISRTIKPIP